MEHLEVSLIELTDLEGLVELYAHLLEDVEQLECSVPIYGAVQTKDQELDHASVLEVEHRVMVTQVHLDEDEYFSGEILILEEHRLG